jgi:hypothetical protein
MKLAAAATPAALAQNFANMDITGMYNQWAANQNNQMNTQLNSIVQQNMNDPQVIAMYNQAVRSGQFQGDLATFAYYYAATGAFSPEGKRNYANTSRDITNKQSQAWAGYMGAVDNYRDAYGAYTGGYARNQGEAGKGLMGQSTYNGASGQQQLPHTWQPNTSHSYQGRQYYVDQSGQYWMVDPNNSGYWYALNR